MKKKIISLALICLLTVSLAMVVSGCGKKKEAKVENPIQITININYPSAAKLNKLENINFRVEKKSTVMEAMQLFCNVNEISLQVDTTSNVIEGISDVKNGDYNNKYIWKYKINGKACNTNASEKVLKSSDSLTWYYASK
ncbi:MAG: DUF4430 domain-containing protein [Clostridiales bacterium]|nr:DUF4430 domain-containing protein [Clostridiales bacterium]